MRKKVMSVIVLTCLQIVALAQSVGLGTSTPIAILDVRGSINSDSLYRIQGGTNYIGGIVLSLKGTQNTWVGLRAAGFTNPNPGHSNTATGFEVLSNAGTSNNGDLADSNTAIGHRAMTFNKSGDNNTACGYSASLFSNDDKTVAIGSFAFHGQAFAKCPNITAVGYQSMYSFEIGSLHVAIGSHALQQSPLGTGSSATRNVAIGTYAMAQDGGDPFGSNTAIGSDALEFGGLYCVAAGAFSLYNNKATTYTTGGLNVAVGYQALFGNTYARYNTAAGYNAALAVDLGYNNTVIGAEAKVGYDSMYNGIALGNLAHATNNSVVRIGNSANWSYGGYASWTNISDGRFKKNIHDAVPGLPFIMALRPVTYQLNATALNDKLAGKEPDDKMKIALAEKEEMVWTGFIAQDIDTVANKLNYKFSGLEKPSNKDDYYGLRYDEFVVPLIKAIQEQQEILKTLKKELAEIKEINHLLLENQQVKRF
jgi:trimeric autotransporter adhesin